MGDSGSMLIGYLLFILTMTLIANREPVIEKLIDRSILPVAPMVIFFVPMIDTLSIFVYRLLNGRSPFSPDRLHLHHMMLKLFRTHSLASCCLVFLNIVLISTFSYFAFNLPPTHFQILFFILFFFCVVILTVIRQYKRKYFMI